MHVAKHSGQTLRVGPIVSSDLFYNPDEGQYERWSKRGILAVEMEAAALFTLGALRGVHAGCLLTVSDIVVEGEFVRISDDELRAAVDRMTRIALDTATAARRPLARPNGLPRQPGLRRAARPGSAGREIAHRAAALGLDGDALLSEEPGQLGALAARGGRRRRRRCSSSSAETAR